MSASPVERLIDAIRKQAAENPDRVYIAPGGSASCRYVWQGQGSCIVGCGAIDAGLIGSPSALEESGTNTTDVGGLLAGLNIEATPEQQAWLDMAQESQDTGHSWSKAVERADAFLAMNTYIPETDMWQENEK